MDICLHERLLACGPLPVEEGTPPEFGVMLQPRRPGMHVGEVPVAWLKQLAGLHQLVLLRGFSSFADGEAMTRYCEGFGPLLYWPFGAVLELREEAAPEDHIFASHYVPLHWDGMYLQQVPEFQVFQCASAPAQGEGGRTTFAHTPLALRLADEASRALWAGTQGHYQRSAAHYSSVARAPLIERHPRRHYPVLRVCEPPVDGDPAFINPSEYRFEGLGGDERGRLLGSLRQALYDPRAFYAHRWQSGDLLIADNFTLLHGREAFASGCARHLRRVHVHAEPPLANPHLAQGGLTP
ncbi:TauD/TfdA family dioxygenase [Pseudomonas mangiferae]|uniref:TauD/TfdA family dioxygenase n=1 Tax=Pseudomonas mangiferae TaxID=2593654 RepID=A0A553H114_9PSED|nr:TauD/TfdA family dioxygenase [Pseudomonas mangiferae]TRX75444.1 TauD/TfdA family dioxygenase [Pseudomonas mangiferae]